VCTHLSATLPTQPLQLEHQVVQPLAVPALDQPLLRCDYFERLWSSSSAEDMGSSSSTSGGSSFNRSMSSFNSDSQHPSEVQRMAAGGMRRVGLDPVAHMRGLTVWRPKPPTGYVALGDVGMAGSEAPRCEQQGGRGEGGACCLLEELGTVAVLKGRGLHARHMPGAAADQLCPPCSGGGTMLDRAMPTDTLPACPRDLGRQTQPCALSRPHAPVHPPAGPLWLCLP